MTDLASVLLSVAAIWCVAIITPGPNFFVTAQTGIAHSRKLALAVVPGLGLGTAIWGLAGFFGVTLLFAAAPWTYLALKVVGGAYLIWLGARLLFSSFRTTCREKQNPRFISTGNQQSAFRLGLLTVMANPKTAAFVTSLFASTLPEQPSLSLGILSVLLMACLSMSWYSVVACVFSTHSLGTLYERGHRWIDRIAGAIYIGFGAQIVANR